MVTIERTQTGMRIERSTLKVLKALAEYLDLSLGDLVEGIVLHAFEGQAPFSPAVLAEDRAAQSCRRPNADGRRRYKMTEEE